MGLTIHYEFHAPDVQDRKDAREIVAKLHDKAKSMQFQDCSKMVDWDHACDDPALAHFRQFLICYDKMEGAEKFLSASPLNLSMFMIRQPGSESAFFGLGRYEETAPDIHDATIRRPTHLTGYHWQAFCKTQYASLAAPEGWDNFFKIHDGICRVIDCASALGVKVTVRDEGNYWETRDIPALHKQIDHWNELIAAFTGRLKDALGGREGSVVAPITESPEFEQMEARGQQHLQGLWEVRRIENPDAPS